MVPKRQTEIDNKRLIPKTIIIYSQIDLTCTIPRSSYNPEEFFSALKIVRPVETNTFVQHNSNII